MYFHNDRVRSSVFGPLVSVPASTDETCIGDCDGDASVTMLQAEVVPTIILGLQTEKLQIQ